VAHRLKSLHGGATSNAVAGQPVECPTLHFMKIGPPAWGEERRPKWRNDCYSDDSKDSNPTSDSAAVRYERRDESRGSGNDCCGVLVAYFMPNGRFAIASRRADRIRRA